MYGVIRGIGVLIVINNLSVHPHFGNRLAVYGYITILVKLYSR